MGGGDVRSHKHESVRIQRADKVIGEVHARPEAHDRGRTCREAIDGIRLEVAVSCWTGGGDVAENGAGLCRDGAGLQAIEIIGARFPGAKSAGGAAGAVTGIDLPNGSGEDMSSTGGVLVCQFPVGICACRRPIPKRAAIRSAVEIPDYAAGRVIGVRIGDGAPPGK